MENEEIQEEYQISEKQDLLIKLKILKSVGGIHFEHSEDMCIQELREIYEINLSLYRREEEIKNKDDLIRKLKWLNYNDTNGPKFKSLTLKELAILYSNVLKENNLTEKDMDNYIEMLGILMMFAK